MEKNKDNSLQILDIKETKDLSSSLLSSKNIFKDILDQRNNSIVLLSTMPHSIINDISSLSDSGFEKWKNDLEIEKENLKELIEAANKYIVDIENFAAKLKKHQLDNYIDNKFKEELEKGC